jgi:hypothetical protein
MDTRRGGILLPRGLCQVQAWFDDVVLVAPRERCCFVKQVARFFRTRDDVYFPIRRGSTRPSGGNVRVGIQQPRQRPTPHGEAIATGSMESAAQRRSRARRVPRSLTSLRGNLYPDTLRWRFCQCSPRLLLLRRSLPSSSRPSMRSVPTWRSSLIVVPTVDEPRGCSRRVHGNRRC